jgi:hypothetical protein
MIPDDQSPSSNRGITLQNLVNTDRLDFTSSDGTTPSEGPQLTIVYRRRRVTRSE